MRRITAYIDGFNLYYGLKEKGWRWFYWLNLRALIEKFLKPEQILGKVKYFTSIVNEPPDKHNRQNRYLEALQTLSNLEIFYGHYLKDEVQCHTCGHIHVTYHEKMTDVNIAVEMITDAFSDRFDTALLVSADSDLVSPIRRTKELFAGKRIVVLFPPGRSSKALIREADGYAYIGADKLSKSLFPEKVMKPDGYVLRRPKNWH